MRFSLVLATIRQVETLDRALQSFAAQTHRDLEVVVVDQNSDARLEPVLARHARSLDLERLTSAPGLSRARNLGLAAATGDAIAFPDDDCWYPPELLAGVARTLLRHPEWDGVAGTCRDAGGALSVNRWPAHPGRVDRQNLWRVTTSISMFFRRRVIETVGGFDESLGVGAGSPWPSGEDADYMLRALAAGFRVQFVPELVVHHAKPVRSHGAAEIRRGHAYGMAYGYLLGRYRYPLRFVAGTWGRSLMGLVVSALRLRPGGVRFYLAALRGRATGWWQGRRAARAG